MGGCARLVNGPAADRPIAQSVRPTGKRETRDLFPLKTEPLSAE